MDKKNILFISSWFPNKLEPTNGNFVQRHAEAVAILHHVEILHAIGDFQQGEKFMIEDKIVNNIRTIIIYYKNTTNPILNFIRRMNAYKKGFSKLKKPDLVHANVLHNSMFFAVWLKKKYQIPFVVTEHWTALRKINDHKTPKTVKFTAKIIGNQAEKILPVSEDLMKGLKNIGIKTPMKIVPNVVDTTIFSPKNIENRKFTFIHVSNLIPRKNPFAILETAIQLLKKGFDFNLQIGGDGSEIVLKKMKEKIAESGFENRIKVFGMSPIEEIAERMQQSDCFILYSDDENQPCVIAESFASGNPVITTNVGGIAEFFPENAGILLKEKNDHLLENAMIEMLERKTPDSEKLKLSAYAQNQFSTSAISEKFSEVYDEILKHKK